MTLKTSIRKRLFLSILLCFLPIHGLLIYTFISRYNDVLDGRISQNLSESLNVVRSQFYERMHEVKLILQFHGSAPALRRQILTRDRAGLDDDISRCIGIYPAIEIMAVADRNGEILASRNFRSNARLAPFSALIHEAQRRKEPVTAIQLVSCDLLVVRGAHLFCNEENPKGEVLVATAVIPVFDTAGTLLGSIISGDVINNDPYLSFTVEKVFGHGVEAVITQGDTPVVGSIKERERSGFRISPAIMSRLGSIKEYRGEAKIGAHYYRTAIEPIRDFKGRVVGTLSVALLEDDYRTIWRENLHNSVWLMLGGTLLLFGTAYYLARRFTKPLKLLIAGTEKIGRGDFGHRAEVASNDELGVLANAFNRMANDLSARDGIIRSNTLELEQANIRLSHLNERLERIVEERTAELQREKRWLEAVLSDLSEGLLVFDVSGHLGMANPAARSMLDLPPQGEVDGEAVRGAMTERIREHLDTVSSGREGEPREDQFEMRGKRLKVNLSPLTGETGELSGVIMSLRDVSMVAPIDDLKRDFISKVSHELKTPLTSIRGALHFILEHTRETSQAERELLLVCYRNTERLMRLISDILDLSKMEAGKMTFHIRPQSVRQVAVLACEEISGYALEQGIHIDNQVGIDFPLVCGDSDRLVQVINNLVSNAIKFSPSDTQVVIRAELKGEMAEVSVIDEGEPIQWLDRELLFRTFQQLDSPQSYRAGTGLGLAICKEIIERHGGRIYYSPVEPKGNRFSFTLPLSQQPSGTDKKGGNLCA